MHSLLIAVIPWEKLVATTRLSTLFLSVRVVLSVQWLVLMTWLLTSTMEHRTSLISVYLIIPDLFKVLDFPPAVVILFQLAWTERYKSLFNSFWTKASHSSVPFDVPFRFSYTMVALELKFKSLAPPLMLTAVAFSRFHGALTQNTWWHLPPIWPSNFGMLKQKR